MTPASRVVAVTGTDTEVGKTVVTAAIAAIQLSLGRSVAVVKPAQTGVGPGDDGDLAEVRRLAGDVSVHEGVRLPDPLAPDTAAAPRRISPGDATGFHSGQGTQLTRLCYVLTCSQKSGPRRDWA